MNLQQQKVVSTVLIQECKELSTDMPGRMSWLGDTTYLVLFRGVLYTWDSFAASTSFCQYIPNSATNPSLQHITRFCVGASLVVVAYAYALDAVLIA